MLGQTFGRRSRDWTPLQFPCPINTPNGGIVNPRITRLQTVCHIEDLPPQRFYAAKFSYFLTSCRRRRKTGSAVHSLRTLPPFSSNRMPTSISWRPTPTNTGFYHRKDLSEDMVDLPPQHAEHNRPWSEIVNIASSTPTSLSNLRVLVTLLAAFQLS